MFESKGRKNRDVTIDGQMYIAKKPIKIAGSTGVLIPKDWLSAVTMGRDLRYFLLDMRDTEIIVKPYYDRIETWQGGEDGTDD